MPDRIINVLNETSFFVRLLELNNLCKLLLVIVDSNVHARARGIGIVWMELFIFNSFILLIFS